MKNKTLIAIATLFALAPAAWAQYHPGQPDLSLFESSLGTQITNDYDYDRPSLALLAELARQDNPELAALIDQAESVRAQTAELTTGEAELVRERLAATAEQLKAEGWNTLVHVRGDDNHVEIFLQLDQDRILGLTALFTDGDEAGFANVAGDFDMAHVMSAMRDLGALRGLLGDLADLGPSDS